MRTDNKTLIFLKSKDSTSQNLARAISALERYLEKPNAKDKFIYTRALNDWASETKPVFAPPKPSEKSIRENDQYARRFQSFLKGNPYRANQFMEGARL